MEKILSILLKIFKITPFINIWVSVCAVIIFGSIGGVIGSCIAYRLVNKDDKIGAIGIILGLLLGSVLNNF